MAKFDPATASSQAGTDRDKIKKYSISVQLVLIALMSLGMASCNDLGTELVPDVCTPQQLNIPENGYQLLNLSEICNIPVESFEAFRLDDTENLELIGRAFNGRDLTMLLKSNGPLSGSADQWFTLKWIDPDGCYPGQGSVSNCRTQAFITINPTKPKTPPKIKLIEIKESDRTPDGSSLSRDFTAIVEDGMKVVWVQGAVINRVAIPRPALPTDHSTHFGHWGDEPIGAMVTDADGVIGYANGLDVDSTTIDVDLSCNPDCPQQSDGSYLVSLNSGDSLDLSASADGGLFGSYEGRLENHHYFWSGLHNATGQAKQRLDEISQSGTILLKVLDSVGNSGQAKLNVSVDGVLAPALAISGVNQDRPVADGGSINQGDELILEAVLTNPTGEYEVNWYTITTHNELSPLGSALSIQLWPRKNTRFRAHLMNNAAVVAVADFQLKVDTTIDYADLIVLQPGADRGTVASESDAIRCGILDSDDSGNCRYAV